MKTKKTSGLDDWDNPYHDVCEAAIKMHERDPSEGTMLMLIDEIRQIFDFSSQPEIISPRPGDICAWPDPYSETGYQNPFTWTKNHRLLRSQMVPAILFTAQEVLTRSMAADK